MPRYYFHSEDGRRFPDEEGTELPSDDAARLEAVRVLGELLRGHEPKGVLDALKTQFEADEIDAQAGEILDLIEAFRESLFFRPLVALPLIVSRNSRPSEKISSA